MTESELQDKIYNRESFLLAQNGQYLGKLTQNRYNSESVMNPYGFYGSKYSTTSIWNPYSTYGSKFSSFSPNNPYTSTPPYIYLRGIKIGVLTANRHLINSLSPDNLADWLKQNNL